MCVEFEMSTKTECFCKTALPEEGIMNLFEITNEC